MNPPKAIQQSNSRKRETFSSTNHLGAMMTTLSLFRAIDKMCVKAQPLEGVYVQIGSRAVPVSDVSLDSDGAIIITLQPDALEARICAIADSREVLYNNSDGLNKEIA